MKASQDAEYVWIGLAADTKIWEFQLGIVASSMTSCIPGISRRQRGAKLIKQRKKNKKKELNRGSSAVENL